MKHCKLYYAGYQHISCDTKNHTHRLRNLQTGEIEIWQACRWNIGIPYKNTMLRFVRIEWDNYEVDNHETDP